MPGVIIFFDMGNFDLWELLKTKPSNPAQSKDGRFMGDRMSSATTLFNALDNLILEILNKFFFSLSINWMAFFNYIKL